MLFGKYGGNAEMITALNAGYEKGGNFWKCIEPANVPTQMPVHSAVALAGIWIQRHLTDATLDRSVIVQMMKARPGDLPGLISLDSNTLFECGQQSMKVEDVMAQGGRLIEREAIPRFAHLLPVGTTKVLIGLQAAGSESVEELLR